MSLLSSLNSLTQQPEQREYLHEVKRVDRYFRRTAFAVLGVWLSLVFIGYMATPAENFEVLEGMELYAARFAFTILLLSLLSSIATTLWLGNKHSSGPNLSGILIASFTVQFIALSTNCMHGSGYPVPVMDDPILGTRVFIFRWCEWTPLAFTMTFLIAGVEPGLPLKYAYALGATQGLSTLMGLILPYCRTPLQWWIIMIISFILYFVMFPVLSDKRNKFRNTEPGTTAHSRELWNRTRLSYRLMQTCTVAWTALVTMYCIAGAAVYYTPEGANEDEFWLVQRPYFTILWESTMDVILKNLYMNIIVQVHKAAFDDGERAQRRLEELRQLLNAVWENSSDVVCISVQGSNGTISTMVSPVYMRLFQNITERPKALVFEMKKEDLNIGVKVKNVKATIVQGFDHRSLQRSEFDSLSNNHSLSDIVENVDLTTSTEAIDETVLSSLAGMIANAWVSNELQTSLTHSLLKKSDNGRKETTPCEANIRWLEDEAMFMLIRDISEQSRRFEAERTMIMQTTARKKDAEANRFTRHEVKNGLLAAIHLCESLAGTEELSDSPIVEGSSAGPDRAVARVDARTRIAAHASELDKELKNILQTVLSDAMARDLIHGVYEPRLGRVELERLLLPTGDRFRMIASPSPLEPIYSDPQLLLYIHRNAMSNACKYGKIDGVVTTRLFYDKSKEMLQMDVENLPGPDHDRLISLGAQASTMVFEPGKRLHGEDLIGIPNQQIRVHSAGDGAWIIRKCAETLKGSATIKFGKDKTTFSFTCPTTLYEKAASEALNFQMPPNTWGVAIDDSKIQRKLLANLLDTAGVVASRRIVQGGTAAEIAGFELFLVDLIQRHSEDYFLVIVDENLDMTHNGFRRNFSGSEFIRKVRLRLMPDQEQRMLALVRSANDSAEDVALYCSRAHGCIPKATSMPASFVHTIGFFWKQRFKTKSLANESTTQSSVASDELNDDFASIVVEEVMGNMDYVDNIFATSSSSSLAEKWPRIWERLHSLKGDLSSLSETILIDKTVDEINSMRGSNLPLSFEERWMILRSQISDIAKAIGGSSSSSRMDAMDLDPEKRGTKRPNPNGDSSYYKSNSTNDGHKKPRARTRMVNAKV